LRNEISALKGKPQPQQQHISNVESIQRISAASSTKGSTKQTIPKEQFKEIFRQGFAA
jgi:hypothetical protein